MLERVLSMVLRCFEGSIFKSFDLYGVNFFLSVLVQYVYLSNMSTYINPRPDRIFFITWPGMGGGVDANIANSRKNSGGASTPCQGEE